MSCFVSHFHLRIYGLVAQRVCECALCVDRGPCTQAANVRLMCTESQCKIACTAFVVAVGVYMAQLQIPPVSTSSYWMQHLTPSSLPGLSQCMTECMRLVILLGATSAPSTPQHHYNPVRRYSPHCVVLLHSFCTATSDC